MIQEKFEDITVKYVYVNEFDWLVPGLAERYNGHPRKGGVYRVIFNPHSKNYKLIMPDEAYAILLDRLVITKKDEFPQEQVSCNLTEIDKRNIIGLKLDEAALDDIIKWQASENVDIRAMYKQPEQPKQVPPTEIIQQAMASMHREEDEAVERASEIMLGLHMTNTGLFYLLLELAERLKEYDLMTSEDPTLSIVLGIEGKGVNIRGAMLNLSLYMDKPRDGGDDRSSLMQAMLHIMTELERRELNDLDDE